MIPTGLIRALYYLAGERRHTMHVLATALEIAVGLA